MRAGVALFHLWRSFPRSAILLPIPLREAFVFRARFSFPLAAGVLALSCGKEETPEPAPIPSVMVMAEDYSFQMPDTLTAGVMSFRVMNHGKELHHLSIVKLAEGQTMASLQQINPTAPLPAGMVLMGGPNFAPPGGAAEAIVDLPPGHYVALCAIPSPDGVPHMAKGMVHEFYVIPAPATAEAANAAVLPSPDVTVQLADFSFTPSAPLSAGHHVIRIENAGTQWHEMVFVKLEPGKTAQDFAQYAEKPEGPPPATPMYGASVLSPGQSTTVVVDLTPGDYALLCFLPDPKDGQLHLMKGMIQQLAVK